MRTQSAASASSPPTSSTATSMSGPAPVRGRRGDGTQRERRPGVWEVRIPVAPDPVTGRRRQLSVTVAGSAAEATARRAQLLAWCRDHPHPVPGTEVAGVGGAGIGLLPPPSRVLVGQLLAVWLAADHPWKPSTYTGYRSVARSLAADPIADQRAQMLTPQQVRARLAAWETAGAGPAVAGGRFRTLRACLSWAYDERLIDTHPLRLMRGPRRPEPRWPLTRTEVHVLLLAAELRLLEAEANLPGARTLSRLHRAEQDLLLVRLAADTGARRGELTALRFTDLTGPTGQPAATGRSLWIQRAVSAGQLTTPKSGHGRRLTLGADTAALWHRLHATWTDRHLEGLTTDPDSGPDPGPDPGRDPGLGPWVFSPDLAHQRRLGAEVLGHRFAQIRDAAGVPDATLHRLRHTVATYLVSHGQILQAQARLGHADAATTLREYSHALPLTDTDTADAINHHLDPTTPDTDSAPHPPGITPR